MILYVCDNLLKVNRVLKLSDNGFEPKEPGDEFPTIAANKHTIKTLLANQLTFILDLAKDEELPAYAAKGMVPHPKNGKGVNFYVPSYMIVDGPVPTYTVEYKDGEKFDYKEGLTEEQIENGLQAGFKIKRVLPESGSFKKSFLRRFGMRVVHKKEFHYAVFKESAHKERH